MCDTKMHARIKRRRELLARLERVENAINDEKIATYEAKNNTTALRAELHGNEYNKAVNLWKTTHPLAYQKVNINEYETPCSEISLSSSRDSCRSLPLTARSARSSSSPRTPNSSRSSSDSLRLTKNALQRSQKPYLKVLKHARRKTIITTIPELQDRCSSMKRADGPGHRPITPTIRKSDITLCVDYIVNPTPAMQPIGVSFHKRLTNLVRDREVVYENLLPWRNK